LLVKKTYKSALRDCYCVHDTRCKTEEARGLIALTIWLAKPDFAIYCPFCKLWSHP